MDALKREMARKRKALQVAKQRAVANEMMEQDPSSKDGGSGGFVKVTDLRQIEQEQRQEEWEAAHQRKTKQQQQQQQQGKHRKHDDNLNDPNNKTNLTNNKRFKSDIGETEDKKQEKRTRVDELQSTQKQQQGKKNTLVQEEDDGAQSRDIPQGHHATKTITTVLSSTELTRQLRMLGLPVRLFGERDNIDTNNESNGQKEEINSRQERLNRALEGRTQSLLGQSERREFQLERGHRIRNPFLEKDDDNDDDDDAAAAKQGEQDKNTSSAKQPAHGGGRRGTKDKSTRSTSNQEQNTNKSVQQLQLQQDKDAAVADGSNIRHTDDGDNKKEDLDDQEKDPNDQILDYFQGLLLEWERVLAARPDSIKYSLAGKTETKTVRQCRDYIRPLFEACRMRQLDQGTLLKPLCQIAQYGRAGEFVKAHQEYMDVAIGRAAWPIGVTMVGIHARTGRAKIESANVAHVMNSELQRKYLTSIKRLLTFAQSQRQDVDPSKKVLS